MKIAMLRVGIDSGSGGIHGPLFKNGTFEYIPIPDNTMKDSRAYGNIYGRYGGKLIEYFPETRKEKMAKQSIHVDPEFETFTYGDPSSPKAGLRHLREGDLLIFYCGLEGWDFKSEPALYLLGYFKILAAGIATEFDRKAIKTLFSKNFHVKHVEIFERQMSTLVLVKGTNQSRLFKKAVKLSAIGRDSAGKPLKILSPKMQKIFGDFDGKLSFQRSPTRWVDPKYHEKVYEFIKSIE